MINGSTATNLFCTLGTVSIDHTITNRTEVLIAMITASRICICTDKLMLPYNVTINNVTLGLRRLVYNHLRNHCQAV